MLTIDDGAMTNTSTPPTRTALTGTPPTRTITAPAVDPGPWQPGDPRLALAKAAALAGAVIDAVEQAQLSQPTPCEQFTVEQLLSHLVAVALRIGVVGRGEDIFSAPTTVEGLGPDGFGAAWRRELHRAEAAWSAPDALTRMVQVPWAVLPGAAALGAYVGEITVHIWDLATAVGLGVRYDEQLLAAAVSASKEKMPAEPRGGPIPFGPVVAVADDAPAIERLVGWMGRDPRWTAQPV